jgi:hypothetical protein
MDFDLKGTIGRLLSRGGDEPLFEGLRDEIERYHGRRVATLSELRSRENKRLKGEVWERFCQLYLASLPCAQGEAQSAMCYSEVWLWREVPSEVLGELGLWAGRLDVGIDIIAHRRDGGGYDAVQCKYLGNPERRVSWRSLSTFVGLTRASGPWRKCIVMTNGKGITRNGPRLKGETSYCRKTFRGIPRETWLRMGGLFVEHRLGVSSPEEDAAGKEEDAPAVAARGEDSGLSLEELRRLRLARFG